MKNKIKKILNSLGLEIRRINHKRLSFDDIYSQKIKKNPIIFDVGANIGQSIIRFRKNFPDSIIHSFEPVEKEYVNLKKKFSDDKKLILNNFALTWWKFTSSLISHLCPFVFATSQIKPVKGS